MGIAADVLSAGVIDRLSIRDLVVDPPLVAVELGAVLTARLVELAGLGLTDILDLLGRDSVGVPIVHAHDG